MRVFKRRMSPVTLTVAGGGRSWFGMASAAAGTMGPLHVEPKAVGFAGGTFGITGVKAGRHEGLELKAMLVDVIGLFRVSKVVHLSGFTAEVLPLWLLSAPRALLATGASSGDASGGVRGSGQEFYGIEEYGPSSERRDILWRRVARLPDERLLTRVREASLPGLVSVGLTEGEMGDRDAWMDLASEAVSQLGVDLIGMGVGIEVTLASGTGVTRLTAYDMDDLADLTVAIWDPSRASPAKSDVRQKADVSVTGRRKSELPGSQADAPSVVVTRRTQTEEEAIRILFTGSEDLSPIVVQVVAN